MRVGFLVGMVVLLVGSAGCLKSDPVREARRERVLVALSVGCQAGCPAAHIAATRGCERIGDDEFRAVCLASAGEVLAKCPSVCDAVRERGLLPEE